MASYDEKTSIDHLLNRSQPDKHPLFTFKWVCDSLPFGLDPSYVESLDLPFANIDQQQGWHGASTFSYYPDFSTISTFSLTFYEDSSASTMQWIVRWKNSIKVLYPASSSDSGTYGAYYLPKNYKRNMVFTMLATDNSPVMQITLINVWPTDTGNLSLDYSQSDRVKITQTFSCDDQTIKFLKSPSAGSFQEAFTSTLLETSTWSNLASSFMSDVFTFL